MLNLYQYLKRNNMKIYSCYKNELKPIPQLDWCNKDEKAQKQISLILLAIICVLFGLIFSYNVFKTGFEGLLSKNHQIALHRQI